MDRKKNSIEKITCIIKLILRITPELFLIIILHTLLMAVLPFVNIIFTQVIIDEFMGYADYKILLIYAGASISLNVIIMLFIGGLTKAFGVVNAKFSLNFDEKIIFHQMNLNLSDIESYEVKEMQRSMEQIKMRSGGMDTVIYNFEAVIGNVFSLAMAAGSFLYVFRSYSGIKTATFWTSSLPFTMLLLAAIMSVICTFQLQTKQNIKISKLNQQANEANGGAMQYMQLISDYHFGKDIRIYGLKNYICDIFGGLWRSSIGFKLTKKLGYEKAVIPCIASVCDGAMTLFVYLFVIMKALEGEITTGTVVLYIGAIQIFMQAILGLVNSVGESMGYGELLMPYLNLLALPEEESIENNRTLLPEGPYTISFQGVSFQYPDSDKWVLRDISFTITSAQRIALVGTNGSGKTTIVKLLCRFYEPQKGRITLNGRDIKYFELESYRNLISAVFQDYSLLSLRLGENIACSDQYAQEGVLTALQKAGLSDWLRKTPELLNTFLYKDFDDSGIEISGGEGQKVAIARAVYKDTPILILDEPTAALDPRAEMELYERFDQTISGKTAIYISHRLSSCRFCDRIIVLHEGKMEQIGTHEQLVERKGKYKRMWEAQAQFYST